MTAIDGTNTTNSSVSTTSFIDTLERTTASSFGSDGDRIKALRAAYALISRLETPWDTVARLAMTEPALGAYLKIFRDLQVFEKWHHLGSDLPQTDADLSALTGAEPELLARLTRHLAANNLLEEVSAGTYRQTAFTKSLLVPVFGSWPDYLYDGPLPCFYKMPEYLAKTGYKNPTSQGDGIFQYTKGCKGTMYDYYEQNSKEGATFNNIMGSVMTKKSMLDLYPYEEPSDSLPNDSPTPLLVDVGGNVGHDIIKILTEQPDVASRLVLQDRPEVLELAKCPPGVQVAAHDFFTPQPVKGARAYYIHAILHNWSDEPSRKILSHLRDAMEPGYSKLLIHDHILPAENVHPQASAYDLLMMAKLSSFERTESMWEGLLQSVGMKTKKIWSSPLATQSIIEAELL
ncbi:S-adenosyl-L-methionine-dependent methyltransferase [Stachybotrys elegans]|uniref:S-adenosyl-L-methionine-dependent methyltransferase n=1 Tax=Stachybotrys elegans TaxID=80388 RepID=A0A8K0SEC5_9HYPO|nr:S-adenosyl-L-methionine-dependent methyltransferase [Stachybotrys elegans]